MFQVTRFPKTLCSALRMFTCLFLLITAFPYTFGQIFPRRFLNQVILLKNDAFDQSFTETKLLGFYVLLVYATLTHFFIYPLKISENFWFSDVFQGVQKEMCRDKINYRTVMYCKKERMTLSGFIRYNQGNLKQILISLIKLLSIPDGEELLPRGLLSHC